MITGDTLREMRKRSGFTQQQLASEVGLSQAHIAKIEGGKVDPRLSTINRIMKVLKKSSDTTCRSIMTKRIISIGPDATIHEASKLMGKKGVSQLPVITRGRVIGTIYEKSIIVNIYEGLFEKPVSSIMSPPLPIVDGSTPCAQVKTLLEHSPAVLVASNGSVGGIISRSDLFKTIGK